YQVLSHFAQYPDNHFNEAARKFRNKMATICIFPTLGRELVCPMLWGLVQERAFFFRKPRGLAHWLNFRRIQQYDLEIMKKSPTENRFIPMTSLSSGKGREVREGLFYYTNQIVNITIIGDPREGDWILVDAGMPTSGPEILSVIEKRF